VAAGAEAVDQHGPEVSAEQIAMRAGVSRTVLYRYFRDRDDLRQAVAERIVTDLTASVLPRLELRPASTPRAVITAVVEVIVGWLDEHPNRYYFLRAQRGASASGDTSLDAVEHTLAARIADLLSGLMVVLGLEAGEAQPGAHGLVGFVEASGAWWLTHRAALSREQFTGLVCRGIWHLIEGAAREAGVVLGYDDPLPG
jgi:AcrR family transcriptional regulator